MQNYTPESYAFFAETFQQTREVQKGLEVEEKSDFAVDMMVPLFLREG